MAILKNKIIFFLFIIFPIFPDNSFACGMCVDHSLDWIAPFILPMFPVAIVYLLTRRILHVFRKLPNTVSKPKLINLIVFIILVIFLSFIGMGSLWLVMIAITAAALQNHIRSCITTWQLTKTSPGTKPQKIFHTIFFVLWLISGVAAMFWTSSNARMMYHLSYKGGPLEQAKSYYATNVMQHKEQIKTELDSACNNPYKIKPLLFSNLFFLSSKLNDLSLAPCIARLLISNLNRDDIYFDLFFEEGLSTLKSLDKAILIKTCITMLDSDELSEKNVENIGYNYGKRLFLILSYLINNSQQNEYKRFITKDNISIMQKYRYQRDIKEQDNSTKSKNIITLEGLNVDLELFNK
ncbi:MAG: hypothetical protein OEM02_03865 [Desulfobulbaceae bacterium]|nr:hypothetical protein [Desulfobulbaceae bacterium]